MNFSRDDDWDVRKEPSRFSKGQLLFWTAVVVVLAAIFSPSERDEAGEEKARQELIRHPFWRVTMDAQAVNEMADAIVASEGQDVLVFVSEDGELFVDTDLARIERADRC